MTASGALVAALRAQGIDLELVGPLPGGEVGAALVRWADGREAVLTRAADSDDVRAELSRTGGLLEVARAAGVPAPRYELVTTVPGAVVIVQERLTGRPPVRADPALAEEIVAIAGRGAGLLRGRADVPAVDLHLQRSGPGFGLHETLAAHDDRTRRLLGRIRRIGVDHATRMAGDDLVHIDLHTGNVLVDRTGAVTGVVDWDGAGRGDHRFALVTLRYDLAVPPADPRDRGARTAAARRLDDRIECAFPDAATLRVYWASMGLRLVDWAVRHHGPDDVDRWIAVAASRLG